METPIKRTMENSTSNESDLKNIRCNKQTKKENSKSVQTNLTLDYIFSVRLS